MRRVGDKGAIILAEQLVSRRANGNDNLALRLDLVPELVRFIQSLDAQFEAAVEKKAKELIMKDQILQDLAYAIQNAEWAIQDRLDKITQRP